MLSVSTSAFRFVYDPSTAPSLSCMLPCFTGSLPDPPTNIQVFMVQPTSFTLSWSPPINRGDTSGAYITYRVEIAANGGPFSDAFGTFDSPTTFVVIMLSSSTVYRIQVFFLFLTAVGLCPYLNLAVFRSSLKTHWVRVLPQWG